MTQCNGDSTGRMVDAFVPAGRDRDEWHYTLRQIRESHGCPCTTTTHTIPRMRSAATGGMWMEHGDFVPGRPVRNCGLCQGVGVSLSLRAALPGGQDA